MGDISKIPTDGLVISSDSDQVGIVERFNEELMFVNESITNFKFKIPIADIDRIEDNKIKLKIMRKDIEKYILKGDDKGDTRGDSYMDKKGSSGSGYDLPPTTEFA